jgi:hypothetical protein
VGILVEGIIVVDVDAYSLIDEVAVELEMTAFAAEYNVVLLPSATVGVTF